MKFDAPRLTCPKPSIPQPEGPANTAFVDPSGRASSDHHHCVANCVPTTSYPPFFAFKGVAADDITSGHPCKNPDITIVLLSGFEFRPNFLTTMGQQPACSRQASAARPVPSLRRQGRRRSPSIREREAVAGARKASDEKTASRLR